MERFQKSGHFMLRDGLAKQRGVRNLCRKKAVFVSSDQTLLKEILFTQSNANDCFEVKFSIESRGGTFIGFCQFTNDSAVGDLWAQFESHPQLWVIIHDEEFCETYRASIRNYKP